MKTYLVHERSKPRVFSLLSDRHIVQVEFLHLFDEFSKQDKFLSSQVVFSDPDHNVAILLHHLFVQIHKTRKTPYDGQNGNKWCKNAI